MLLPATRTARTRTAESSARNTFWRTILRCERHDAVHATAGEPLVRSTLPRIAVGAPPDAIVFVLDCSDRGSVAAGYVAGRPAASNATRVPVGTQATVGGDTTLVLDPAGSVSAEELAEAVLLVR